jgi:hypothetical protein
MIRNTLVLYGTKISLRFVTKDLVVPRGDGRNIDPNEQGFDQCAKASLHILSAVYGRNVVFRLLGLCWPV